MGQGGGGTSRTACGRINCDEMRGGAGLSRWPEAGGSFVMCMAPAVSPTLGPWERTWAQSRARTM